MQCARFIRENESYLTLNLLQHAFTDRRAAVAELRERKKRFASCSPVWLLNGILPAYRINITGSRGFDYAQVTAGGADCGEFDPSSMESVLIPGLYAAGEVLNVDGDCGGFNLMFAFASGRIAGCAV